MRAFALYASVLASCGAIEPPKTPPLQTFPDWVCTDPPPEFDKLRREAAKEGKILYWVATPCTLKAD